MHGKYMTRQNWGKLDKINETYKNCLDDGKTERECITLAVQKRQKLPDIRI